MGGMLYLTYGLNALLMVFLPLLLGIAIQRRFGAGWGLFALGATAFVGSQVVHIPLNVALARLVPGLLTGPAEGGRLLMRAAILGLTAGLCEETARYLVFRRLPEGQRTWANALMVGAGHGGVESILLGVLAGIGFVQLAMLRGMDLEPLGLPPNQLATLKAQLAAYWSTPWYLTLVGAGERVLAMTLHLAWSVVVLQAVNRRNPLWLLAAIAGHTLVDGTAVYGVARWGIPATEMVIAAFAVAGLAVVFPLRGREEPSPPLEEHDTAPPGPPAPVPEPAPALVNPAELRRQLDETRFSD